MLETLLADTARAWILTSSGRYERAAVPEDATRLDAQKALIEHYAERAAGRRGGLGTGTRDYGASGSG